MLQDDFDRCPLIMAGPFHRIYAECNNSNYYEEKRFSTCVYPVRGCHQYFLISDNISEKVTEISFMSMREL